jgi:serine/threonine-protein kinase
MLTGHRPFEADSSLDVLMMHVNAQPRPLREVAPGAAIPPSVERAVLRLLAKRPEQRFQSARELRHAFELAAMAGWCEAGVSGVAPTILAGAPMRSARRSPLIRFAIMAAGMATLLGHHLPGAVANRQQIAASQREPPARAQRQTPARIQRQPLAGTLRSTPAQAEHDVKKAPRTASKRAVDRKR